MKLLMGVELNIMDFEGNVDLDQDLLEKLDYSIASLHQPCIKAALLPRTPMHTWAHEESGHPHHRTSG